MIARARVALGGSSLTPSDRAAGGLDQCERAEFTGEAPDTGNTPADWERAKGAAGVPDDGLVLYWLREA